MVEISIALVHWPVIDRTQNEVVTNVTHFDIHDIARAAKTYGIKNYFIVNRLQEQLMYVARILNHWKVEKGAKFNPKRREALGIVKPVETIEKMINEYYEVPPIMVTTSAKNWPGKEKVSFTHLRNELESNTSKKYLLLFGTGNGLHSSVIEKCDLLLEPIKGARENEFRHLSVRSAVSITLDRLLGV